MMSRTGDDNWCALAAIINYYGSCRVLSEVSSDHFNPPPHVESCFIRIDVRPNRLMEAKDDAAFVKLVKCCFLMRRKTLVNNLKAVYGLSADDAAQILNKTGLDVKVRGEALTLPEIADLCHNLQDFKR